MRRRSKDQRVFGHHGKEDRKKERAESRKAAGLDSAEEDILAGYPARPLRHHSVFFLAHPPIVVVKPTENRTSNYGSSSHNVVVCSAKRDDLPPALSLPCSRCCNHSAVSNRTSIASSINEPMQQRLDSTTRPRKFSSLGKPSAP